MDLNQLISVQKVLRLIKIKELKRYMLRSLVHNLQLADKRSLKRINS